VVAALYAASLTNLDAIQRRNGSGIANVACVQRGFWLEQKDVGFFLGNRKVFHAARNHYEFAFFEMDIAVPQPNQQTAFHHQEQLILGIVMVPDKLAFQFYELYVRIVDLSRDLRTPVILKQTEFLA
jgi:hypothetical protein